MKKRFLSLALAIVFVLTLVPTAFAAPREPYEGEEFPEGNVFRWSFPVDHDYLGKVKVGGLYLGANEEEYTSDFSIFVVDDDVEVFTVEAYSTTDNEYRSLVGMYSILYLGYELFDEETGDFEIVDDGKAHLYWNFLDEEILGTKDAPISFEFPVYSDSWSPMRLVTTLFDVENSEVEGYMTYSAVVLTRSQVAEFNETGTFPMVYDAFGELEMSEYLDLAELKAAISDAPETPVAPLAPVPAPTVEAIPTTANVLVDGDTTAFDAYNIAGNNYFKLRDLAYVLNGSEKQFSVGWDGELGVITLVVGEEYEAVGGEMTEKGDAEKKAAVSSTATVYINGEAVALTAFNIDGNNYFKLRDLGTVFDFSIAWDGELNTITIDTSLGYTAE